jgi:hypothetical protein
MSAWLRCGIRHLGLKAGIKLPEIVQGDEEQHPSFDARLVAFQQRAESPPQSGILLQPGASNGRHVRPEDATGPHTTRKSSWGTNENASEAF